MSGGFKENVFSGSRFLFWGIVPLGGLLLLAMQFADERPAYAWYFWAFDGIFLLFALGLWNPSRFRWALRIVSGLVFALYGAYVYNDLTKERNNLLRSIAGLLIIGIPAATYAVLGRFSFRHREGFDEWINRLTQAKDVLPFMELFTKVTAAPYETDLDLSLRTLLAAEMIAAANGYDHENMSQPARDWARRNPRVVTPALAQCAADAVNAAALNPHLNEIWDEDDPREFEQMLDELRNHLIQIAAR